MDIQYYDPCDLSALEACVEDTLECHRTNFLLSLQGQSRADFWKAMRAKEEPNPWWLPTDVNLRNCIAAYIPKGAASLNDSYNNIAHPGTFTLSENTYGWDRALHVTHPNFDTATGWTFLKDDPGSNILVPMPLDTGITSAEIGRGTGTVVCFVKGIDTTIPTYYLMPFGTEVFVGVFDAGCIYWEFANNPPIFTPNGHWIDPANGTPDYNYTENPIAEGMVAVAGQNVYFNGTYQPNALDPWTANRDGPSIYIGASHAIYYDALGNNMYPPSYCEIGFMGQIPAILFFDVVLTQAQLDELRANAIAAGIL